MAHMAYYNDTLLRWHTWHITMTPHLRRVSLQYAMCAISGMCHCNMSCVPSQEGVIAVFHVIVTRKLLFVVVEGSVSLNLSLLYWVMLTFLSTSFVHLYFWLFQSVTERWSMAIKAFVPSNYHMKNSNSTCCISHGTLSNSQSPVNVVKMT
jgi:hypothetical protein